MTAVSPLLIRRRLGARLRALREGRGWQLGDVASRLGWSESKLSRAETGQTALRAGDLDRLLIEYAVGETDRADLVAWGRQSRQRGWWAGYADVLPDAYETYIAFEAEATSIRGYEAQIVSGLLQTAEYASAVIRADRVVDDRVIEHQLVAVRMARQAVLTRDPAPELSVILDEAVLRRPIGGWDVHRRQLLRLVEAGEQDSCHIRVLPFAAGGHRSLAGSFYLLDFADESDKSLVYSEGATGGVLRGRTEEVEAYRQRLEALEAAAMSPEDSAALLLRAASGNK